MTLDVAYTRAVRRESLPHRAFAVAQGGAFLDVSALTKVSGKEQGIVMVFSGQGAQWAESKQIL
jgi:acyl transferase domain-containing protein